MKPFDLEAFKAGKPAVTRDGRKARFVTTMNHPNYPIIVIIRACDGGEVSEVYTEKGEANKTGRSRWDLFMPSEKKEGWVILEPMDGERIACRCPLIFNSHSEAEKHINSLVSKNYVIAHITWEE